MRKFVFSVLKAPAVVVMFAVVCAAEGGTGESVRNLLPQTLETLDREDVPFGWGFEIRGENPESASVSTFKDETGADVAKAVMAKESSVWFSMPNRPEEGSWPMLELDQEKDYMLVLELKVEDMFYTGSWFQKPAAINLGVYGTAGKHVWMAVHGEGGTEGWVTAILPFPPEQDRANYAKYRVLIRCNNMTGTVYLRNPAVLERPASMGMERVFELKDGRIVTGNQLQLGR